MPRYLLVYIDGNPPASHEESKKQMKRYKEWLASLGDSVVSPANPVTNTHIVSPDGSVREGGKTGMSGYTIIEAESIEHALVHASLCPFLEMCGSMEVSELVEMNIQ
ncbi:hypothetical protein P7F88_21415 [Vibrio hannami]|uniref:hypothetical protein n=1 Tax=Vibrio hannami TaxID=2717094 RepID=UPI00240F995F|nr:hypothetical protein [Vibrio hannami]MDG3088481.1 hypothetical protein [Vibrio hannami]